MTTIPKIDKDRVQHYILVVTEPLRQDALSLEQIKSFCRWFDNIILFDIKEDHPDETIATAQKPISALASYNKQLAAIVLKRNKWLGDIDLEALPEANKDLVELIPVIAEELRYSVTDFVDALVRIIAARANDQRIPSLTNFLDIPLAFSISGDR